MKSNMLTFDTEKYNFRKLLLDSINQLDDKNLIEDLDKIHLKYGYDDIPKIEKKVYDLFKSNIFITKYSALCEDLIDRLNLVRTSYQKIPSIRIHMPGIKSVNFHTDNWYGHGDKIKNFWLPVVDVKKLCFWQLSMKKKMKV